MSFRLVPNLVILDDLERRNGPLHCVISLNLVNPCSNTWTHNRGDLWRNLCTSLL